MRAKPIIYLLLSYVLSLQLMSCSGKEANAEKDAVQFKDSISYWLSKKNADTKSSYAKNLRKALDAAIDEPNDSLKATYASKLSLQFYEAGDSLYFKKANKFALLSAAKIGDSSKIADAHWDAGDFFRDRAINDSSFYNYAKAQKLYQKRKNDYNSARMLYNMAWTQGQIKDNTSAENNIIRAISLFKPLEKFDRLYNCYNYLGIISKDLENYDKALEYFELSQEYIEKLEKKGTLKATAINNIGGIYLAQEKYELALSEFLKGIETDSLRHKNPELYAKLVSQKGQTQYKLGKLSDAEKTLKKSVAIKDSIGDVSSLSRSYYNLSELYLITKDTVEAFKYAKLAEANALASDNNLRVLETLELLTRIDPENAVTYSQRHFSLNDSLLLAEHRIRNKFERIRFETNETLAENASLERQSQLLTGIIAALLLLAASIYIIISQRRKNEKLRFQEEQQASNQRIFNMLLSEKSNLEEGKKQEQKRISEELHDAVQGRIQGIRMLLLGLNKRVTPEAIEMRSEAITELQDVQEEIRAISHELSYAAYKKLNSFIITIEELLNATEKSTGIKSTFEYDKEIEWDNLSGDIKINVYRIIQECIQNCTKHANAKNIELTFAIEENRKLLILLQDDGKGFKVTGSKKGIGMRNINSRVEKVGGSWEISSEIDKGTLVTLYIPVKAEVLVPELIS